MSDWVARSHLIELLEATAKARGGFESFRIWPRTESSSNAAPAIASPSC